MVFCYVTVDEKNKRFRWRRLTGDLLAFEGQFHLKTSSSKSNGTVVEYRSFVDPGGIGRLLMTRSRRTDMVLDMVPRLKRLVE